MRELGFASIAQSTKHIAVIDVNAAILLDDRTYLWLLPLGFVIAAYGTLIGASGGFVLVPLLLLLYPKESPEIITSISLAVVFFNAASGSVAYARMKRIDYKSGIIFSIATIPGAILGPSRPRISSAGSSI